MADGVAVFEYQPKAKTLGPTIGDGQIEMRHLSPALFLEIQNLRMHKHSGVGSQKLRGFESIYKRTVRADQLRDDAVEERTIKDGAVTQEKAPTLLKGPANNYLTAVGTASFTNIPAGSTANTTVSITGFSGNVKPFLVPEGLNVAASKWHWWIDDVGTSSFKIYLRNHNTSTAINVNFLIFVLGT